MNGVDFHFNIEVTIENFVGNEIAFYFTILNYMFSIIMNLLYLVAGISKFNTTFLKVQYIFFSLQNIPSIFKIKYLHEKL
jgi:hypothetical protein